MHQHMTLVQLPATGGGFDTGFFSATGGGCRCKPIINNKQYKYSTYGAHVYYIPLGSLVTEKLHSHQ